VTKQLLQWQKSLSVLCISVLAAVWLYPMIESLHQSLKINGFHNYLAVIHYPGIDYFRTLFNSFFISVSTCLLVTLFSSLGAYCFSKMKFFMRPVLYYALLACLAIPPAAVISPLFVTAKTLGVMNSYWAVILPLAAFNAPFMLLIIKNYFDAVPDSILEAATIDGCSRFRMYYTIMIPLGLPAILNVAVLTFIYSWNDFLMPLMFIREKSMFTVTLASQFFSGTVNQTPEMVAQLYAALILMTIPSLILYFFSQRFLKAGLTAGAVKS
jgi:raffinose/stachyose/melibiose transport system permease protein